MLPIHDVRRVLESVGLVPGLAVAEMHARLEVGLRLADTGQRVLAFYLADMEDRRVHQSSAHGSTAHYAEARLGLDRRRTSELISVGRKLLTLPAIDRAFCKQELPWSKLLLLVTVASPEHEDAWLLRAQEISCQKLALEVRGARPGSAPRAPGERKGLPEIRFKVAATVRSVTHKKLDLAKQKLSAEHGRALGEEEFLDLMADLVLGIEADGSVPGYTRVSSSLYRIVLRPEEDGDDGGGRLLVDSELGPVPVDESECVRCDAEIVRVGPHDDGGAAETGPGELAPKTPPALRRRVLLRDGQRCRSCGSRHRLMAHHIRFREDHGPTKAFNLITLCERCHGLVHDGLLVLEGESEDRIRFLDAEGRPVGEAVPDPERAAALTLSPPSSAAAPALVPQPGPQPVTLEALPDVVAAEWWGRHAHLVRFGRWGLELQEGIPLSEAPSSPPEAPAKQPVPSHEAFAGIVGQDALLSRVEAAAAGSEARGRPFPHVLLTGPAGTGKTTLAHALARRFGKRLVKATGPLLQDLHELVRLMADLREGDVFFLEEAHAAPRPVLEALYEAMAERRFSLTLHAGSRVRTLRFDLPGFTLVAATTEEGDLPEAMLGRFGLRERLDYYGRGALVGLVESAARKEGFTLDPEASGSLAELARGTPREALRLLDRVLDDAARAGLTRVPRTMVAAVFERLGYDARGLEPLEQRYVEVLRRSAVPVPLARLSRLLGTGVKALLRDVEPFLFRCGLIQTTPRGRVAVHRPRLLEA